MKSVKSNVILIYVLLFNFHGGRDSVNFGFIKSLFGQCIRNQQGVSSAGRFLPVVVT